MGQPRNFSPTDLADLIAVYDTGSMTKAAELNQRTKPAVSMTITRLERAVGFAILERPSWAVKFTDRGEALVAKARVVMAELDSLSKFADVLATGIEPQVSLAVDQAVPEDIWLPVVAKVTSAYPETKFEFIAADGTKAYDLLQTGHAQVAMLLDTSLYPKLTELDWGVIQPVEFTDVCKIGTPFHGQDRPLSIPQINLIDDPNHHDCQHVPRCITVSSRLVQLALILDGVGWGRIPTHLITERLDGGRLMQFTPAADMPFYPSIVICRGREQAGPVAEFLWQSLGELC